MNTSFYKTIRSMTFGRILASVLSLGLLAVHVSRGDSFYDLQVGTGNSQTDRAISVGVNNSLSYSVDSLAVGTGNSGYFYNSATVGSLNLFYDVTNSTIFGSLNYASYAFQSLIVGTNNATSESYNSAIIGSGLIGDGGAGSLITGRYNQTYGSDILFAIGNGNPGPEGNVEGQYPDPQRHDALVVYESGEIDISGSNVLNGPSIVLDPNTPSITINGYQVLTTATGSGGSNPLANLGVGTTSPQAKLHVVGGGAVIGSSASINNTNGALSIGSTLQDYSPNQANWTGAGSALTISGLNYSDIAFHDAGNRVDFIRSGNGTIQLGYNGGWGEANIGLPGGGLWKSNGYVGIGTTTPAHLLSVGSYAYVNSDGSAVFSDGFASISDTGVATFAGQEVGGFWLYNGYARGDSVAGIDTSSGTASFTHIAGDSLDLGDEGIITAGRIQLGYGASVGNDYGIKLNLDGSATFPSNVGIGTASPQAKLDVNGDVKIAGIVKMAMRQGDIQMGEFGNLYSGD